MPLTIAERLALKPETTSSNRETIDEASERLDVSTSDAAMLRELCGCHFEDITSVDNNDDGVIVTTRDGVEMIWREVDQPDANGNVGLLYYRRPDGRTGNEPDAPQYRTPVFAKPVPPKSKTTRKTKADE